MVASIARTCIRPDYVQIFEDNLPRWIRDGLWQSSYPRDIVSKPLGSETIGKAYSWICLLDKRMKDDAICSRMAMVLLHLEYEHASLTWNEQKLRRAGLATGIGRANISTLIDKILENAHREWNSSSSRRKAELRAQFHQRKRHGKRWWLLVDILGPSILILCSSKLAGIIRDTTVTIKTLKALSHAIETSDIRVMSILKLANPIASSLLHNQGYSEYNGKEFIERFRALSQQLRK
ncbi:hypothetical protein LI328DRAFT_155154 [Trichoderma asperelloides]|nr:hypothetical protein LI328DRAFT_155154 [Trichoderma asperelloides]